MNSYLISFQLINDNDYQRVSDIIRRYPKWARIMNNVWIVKSDSKLVDIRENISSIVNTASILVMKINNNPWGTYSVDREVTNWMKENI